MFKILFKNNYIKYNINIKMNNLIKKNPNELITPESINFTQLVRNSNTTLSLSDDYQSNMIKILNEEFTEEESRWYIANLYIYMNYHPTNDYPINLENVFKMIGFANKGNAMKTIKSNFTKNEDYKTSLLPKEKSSWGGSGSEQIMLNVDTFKSLCMLAKTDKDERVVRKAYDTTNREQDTIFLSSQGVYRLLYNSNSN